MSKCVLAYSGGLDTTVATRWLKEKRNLTVIAYCCNLGQTDDLEVIGERALASGASSARVEDLRDRFVQGFVAPAFKADATYGRQYLLSSALGRPLIAQELVRTALEEGATHVAHGCTGKGNDQVRFDAAIAALAPQLTIIAPLRDWEMKSREEEIAYARRFNIPISVTKESPYSYDLNLWGQSIEGGALEDPWNAPPEDAYTLTRSPEKAPNAPAEVEIEFDQGLPCALDGRRMSFRQVIETLNPLAGSHGVGRVDLVEDRLVGIKTREIYEMPAATVLFAARRALESLVLARDVLEFKRGLSERYGLIVYNGQWFSDLREALDGFFNQICRFVCGQVRCRLFKGAATVVGCRSAMSLYDEALATYSAKDAFDHAAATGFVKIWSLPLRVQAHRKAKQ